MTSNWPDRSDPRWQDLTARARIRDTALQQFADQGYSGTTIRGIAEVAGVSPALVQHHFRNKESLRDACDEFVVGFLHDQLSEGIYRRGVGEPGFISAAHRGAALPMRYLGRAMVDDLPSASPLFDTLVELTARYLASSPTEAPDETRRVRAAVLTSMHLGVLMLHGQLSRTLGVDTTSPEGLSVIGETMLDLLDPGIAGPGTEQLARRGLNEYRAARNHE